MKFVEGTPDIKILSGMRRAGKSMLLEEMARRIRKAHPKAHVMYADLTLIKNARLMDYLELHKWVKAHTKRGSEKIYVQVSDDISEMNTLKREINPLMKIRDAYPKLLIARTKHDEIDRDGVRILDIARWLDGKECIFAQSKYTF